MRKTLQGAIALALLAAFTGCSNKTAKKVAEMNTSNIQRLANMYAAYQNYRGGRGPKDEADFKSFIKDFEAAKLEMMGIDPNGLDGLFKSERDSKPFKIRYNVGGGRGSVAPVIFEADGVGGKKQIGYTGGKVEDVDESAYKELWAAKGESGSSGGPGGGDRPIGKPEGAPMGGPPGK